MTLGTADLVKLEVGTRVSVLDTADAKQFRGKEGVVVEVLGPYPPAVAALAQTVGLKIHENADAIFVALDNTPDPVALFADEVEGILDA